MLLALSSPPIRSATARRGSRRGAPSRRRRFTWMAWPTPSIACTAWRGWKKVFFAILFCKRKQFDDSAVRARDETHLVKIFEMLSSVICQPRTLIFFWKTNSVKSKCFDFVIPNILSTGSSTFGSSLSCIWTPVGNRWSSPPAETGSRGCEECHSESTWMKNTFKLWQRLVALAQSQSE